MLRLKAPPPFRATWPAFVNPEMSRESKPKPTVDPFAAAAKAPSRTTTDTTVVATNKRIAFDDLPRFLVSSICLFLSVDVCRLTGRFQVYGWARPLARKMCDDLLRGRSGGERWQEIPRRE